MRSRTRPSSTRARTATRPIETSLAAITPATAWAARVRAPSRRNRSVSAKPRRPRGFADFLVHELLERLDDRQRVPARVAEPEHRRHGRAPARDLRIDVDAGLLQRRVVGLDVVGRDDDPAVDGGRAALHRRRQRDGGRGALRGDLDPLHLPVGEGLVDPLLEAELVDVERERAILIGRRNGYAADLGDVELAGLRSPFWVFATSRAQTVGRVETHR